LSFVKKIRT